MDPIRGFDHTLQSAVLNGNMMQSEKTKLVHGFPGTSVSFVKDRKILGLARSI